MAGRGSVQAVRLAAHEGRALARCGDRAGTQDAFARAQQARTVLDEAPTGSIFSFDSPYLPFYAGTAYSWLSDPQATRRSACEAIALCDSAPQDWPVARALARIDLATAYMKLKDVERAVALGHQALDIYEQERSVDPILRRAAQLSDQLATHGSVPQVAGFEERRAALRSPGLLALTGQ
jgi:tetratricopeptide (TPR) repeat protein